MYTMAQKNMAAAVTAYAVNIHGKFNPIACYADPIDLVRATEPDPNPAILFGGKNGTDAGFIGLTKPDAETGKPWIMLALRGTLSPSSLHWNSLGSIKAFFTDWYEDDKTRHVDMKVDGHLIGKVDRGFKHPFDVLWPQIQTYLDTIKWDDVSGIQISGHSKGAAMTFAAAATIKILYPAAHAIHVHAFAAPLFGDPAFAKWYNDNGLGSVTTRYQRVYDLVPFLPPSVNWDIFHHLKKPSIRHPGSYAMELLFSILESNIYGNYEEVGSLIGLTTEDPKTSEMTTGAEEYLRQHIRNAIFHSDIGLIADAHSATDSYWPAFFCTDSSTT